MMNKIKNLLKQLVPYYNTKINAEKAKENTFKFRQKERSKLKKDFKLIYFLIDYESKNGEEYLIINPYKYIDEKNINLLTEDLAEKGFDVFFKPENNITIKWT